MTERHGGTPVPVGTTPGGPSTPVDQTATRAVGSAPTAGVATPENGSLAGAASRPGDPRSGGGQPTDALVALDAVHVTFVTRKGLFRSGRVRALNGVTLAVARGETLALVGESGSGKTTLGRVSLRLTDPTSGTVTFDGQDVTRLGDADLGWFRRRAQIVFQDPFSSLNPYMRVGDLVAEPLVIDGVRDGGERGERVRAALEAVELLPAARFSEKYPTQMSGGQRQRVGIARALVRDPEYIVADEPVSMIDASSRIEILDLLRGLQEGRGVAFLSITHDIASARHFADRIAVMYLGQVVELGAAGQVVEDPLHPYTQALIAAVPEPDPSNRFRRRAVVPGEQTGAADLPSGCPFHPRCPRRIPGVCDVVRPLLADHTPGHAVACHLYPASTPGPMPPGSVALDLVGASSATRRLGPTP
ncbi:MAG: ABC transporter, ATP-binding protein (cluster 5, nickel/peptides/opines) [uncultured Thermomicrobiales bacterium]|uniref:ABC transporter, ATP-binding protein (Cluster 5, nickel/peptides/opines) n=1 Tax=uncultured Thermomicrobiales bacterium TaxID=1645740 RepID=A0A6J4U614_9BACT|nr:MAG: ABC transporter, ATP-binding protein (cluster 5, nickel/peptides/opines) [uncultured Thermomicrobiales bacterium]